MATVSARGEYGEQGADPEEDHAPTTVDQRRRSECIRAGECLGVQPDGERASEKDGDNIPCDQHSEPCGDPCRVPAKRPRAAVAQRRATLETGVRKYAGLDRLWYG